MADEALRDRLLADLAPLGVRSHAMFGGHGLYLGEKFFGVVSGGRVYFRTDEDSREDYVRRGMPPLESKRRPRGPKTVDRNFEVPPEVLGDASLLVEWAIRAAQAK